ncbi:MFS transporter [Labrys miyagiensis]|uniref:MFS transporter n=1 Tax=Labrys miyagiensis TaxID=346912 RepID=A0ABQ6CVG9_9HYPH|nr:MFS transporter [Labrys miyagiensis]GLS23813.1 MFS transporter [Labrys miyagiensis]
MDQMVHQRRVLAATSISYVIVILDISIVNVALKPIATSLGIDIAGLQWMVNAYTLTFASLLLTGGTLGDRLGACTVYGAGLATFTLASALCGLAPTLATLIAARTLQGLGAALLVPCSLTLINNAYEDPQRRSGAFGLWAGLGGIAMAAGPLVGGVLIHLFGWRSIFLVNVPIGIAGLLMLRQVEADGPAASSRHLDLAGQASAILALGLFTAFLIGGPGLGWRSPPALFMLVVSLAAGAVFLAIESRHSQPMLPLAFFRNGVFSSSVAVSMISAFTFYGLIFVLSLDLQEQCGMPPLVAGLAFLPLTALISIGSMLSRRAAALVGSRRLVSGAFLMAACGFLAMLAAGPASPLWRLLLPMPLIGLAASLITPATTTALMATVEGDRAGIAAGVLNAARQTGAALGVAGFGALVAALHPFAQGMAAGLFSAAILSVMGALIWWRAAIRPSAPISHAPSSR